MRKQSSWYEVWWWDSGSQGSYGPYARKRDAVSQQRWLLRSAPGGFHASVQQVRQEEQGRLHRTVARGQRTVEGRVKHDYIDPRDPDAKWR